MYPQNYQRLPRFSVLLILFSLSLMGADMPSFELPAPEEEQQEEAAIECCFIHPNYQGICVVVPAEDETCESILQYLNTPATVGKTYCDTSRIRGGWDRVDCPADNQ
jgi:hypothetical protein